jgi:prophage regulatory protein
MLFNVNTVCKITTLSKSTIYRLIKEGRFPNPIHISRMRVGWREADILAFTQNGLAK